jgi:hypothetical protein
MNLLFQVYPAISPRHRIHLPVMSGSTTAGHLPLPPKKFRRADDNPEARRRLAPVGHLTENMSVNGDPRQCPQGFRPKSNAGASMMPAASVQRKLMHSALI